TSYFGRIFFFFSPAPKTGWEKEKYRSIIKELIYRTISFLQRITVNWLLYKKKGLSELAALKGRQRNFSLSLLSEQHHTPPLMTIIIPET
ncbi:MAG: hypothetical protein ACYTEN_06380, partial [Planctomycetota bacterium]